MGLLIRYVSLNSDFSVTTAPIFYNPGGIGGRVGLWSSYQLRWARVRLIGMQIINYVLPTKPLSRRERELRKRIEGKILRTAADDGTEIGEEEFRRRVFLEEASRQVRMPGRVPAFVGGFLMGDIRHILCRRRKSTLSQSMCGTKA